MALISVIVSKYYSNDKRLPRTILYPQIIKIFSLLQVGAHHSHCLQPNPKFWSDPKRLDDKSGKGIRKSHIKCMGCDFRHFLNMRGLQSPYNVELQTAAAKLPNDGGWAEVEMGMAMAGLLSVSICECEVNANVV